MIKNLLLLLKSIRLIDSDEIGQLAKMIKNLLLLLKSIYLMDSDEIGQLAKMAREITWKKEQNNLILKRKKSIL